MTAITAARPRRLEAVGYWFNELAPSEYPRPQALVGRWQAARRAAVVAYLRAGTMFESYGGSSFCRFGCGVTARAMGHRDRFDGAWVWPEGLAHYVEVHAVRLPERFVRRAVRGAAPPPTRPAQRDGLIDDARWLAWGRARGAALALAPWTIPDWAQRERLDARWAARVAPPYAGAAIVLWRADTGAAVGRLGSGALAIVELGQRRPPPPRLLTGWDAWPRRAR